MSGRAAEPSCRRTRSVPWGCRTAFEGTVGTSSSSLWVGDAPLGSRDPLGWHLERFRSRSPLRLAPQIPRRERCQRDCGPPLTGTASCPLSTVATKQNRYMYVYVFRRILFCTVHIQNVALEVRHRIGLSCLFLASLRRALQLSSKAEDDLTCPAQ